MNKALREYLISLSEDLSYIVCGIDRVRLDEIYYPLIIRAESRLMNRYDSLKAEILAYRQIRSGGSSDDDDWSSYDLLENRMWEDGHSAEISELCFSRYLIQSEWAAEYGREGFSRRFEFDRGCRGALLAGRKAAGKTVFLRRMALYYADKALGRTSKDETYEPYGLQEGMIPCLIHLPETGSFETVELIRQSIERYSSRGSAESIMQEDRDKLLLLVDGYDNVLQKKKALAELIRYAGKRDSFSMIVAVRESTVREMKEDLDGDPEYQDLYFRKFTGNAGLDIKYILNAVADDDDYRLRWAGCRMDGSHRQAAIEKIISFNSSKSFEDEDMRMMVSTPQDVDILFRRLAEGSLNVFSLFDDLAWLRLKGTVYNRRELFNDIASFLGFYVLAERAEESNGNRFVRSRDLIIKHRDLFDGLSFFTDIADARNTDERTDSYPDCFDRLLGECEKAGILRRRGLDISLNLIWADIFAARFICGPLRESAPDILKCYKGQRNWYHITALVMFYFRYSCHELYEQISADISPDEDFLNVFQI
ncbi:MAG: hypothetical protein J5744_02270 [Oscillospiraceae bacterium]|nr:hypothetical protein [Oscillospiraceae bacterium]